jgi:hypothetical protein
MNDNYLFGYPYPLLGDCPKIGFGFAKPYTATRKELNADMMIIATALAHDATIIYSHDKALRAMADGHIIAKDFTDEME